MAPVNSRPRSYAERPAGPLAPKPANGNVLGAWENGVFRFASPEARETWKRKSYEQGVGEETWHLGKEIDAESAAITQAGLGGANPGLYQGPDGTYRLMNAKTIESQEARDHRNKYLAGKTIDQIAAANAMPGTDEWVEKGKASQAVNDNSSDYSNNQAVRASTLYRSEVTEEQVPRLRPYEGRSGFRESTQGGRDAARGIADAIMGDSIEEITAAATAAKAWMNGGSFAQTFGETRKKEEAESQSADERLGLLSPLIKVAVGFIPGVGDASGAAADIKDYVVNGDTWRPIDYGMALLGAGSLAPNGKTLKHGKELVEGLLDKARSALKGEGDELLESADGVRKSDVDEVPVDELTIDEQKKNLSQGAFDPRQYFPKDENDILTEAQALNLPGEKVGLQWVVESETHHSHAAAYEREGDGYVWSEKHGMPAKPSLRWDNPDGDDLVKFDHLDPTPQATYLLILVDSKADVPPSFRGAQKTAAADLRRQINAVRQNNKVTKGPKFKIRYELPDESRAEAMRELLRSLGYADEAIVVVREASQGAQNKFKKLRKKE